MKGARLARRALQEARTAAARVLLSRPRRVRCNVCGWAGRHLLSDDWHPHVICPSCGSDVRHRLLLAALEHVRDVSFAALARGKRVLHVAPEPRLGARLREEAARYVTADLLSPHVDWNLDLCDMQGVADGALDLVVACDVLEHVPDDRQALRELHRVLAPGGVAVLTVPQDGRAETYEDPSVICPKERERLFGQFDHRRIYGDDFTARLEAAEFSVRTVDSRSFPEAMVRELVLAPAQLSTRPLATNHRTIFFARR